LGVVDLSFQRAGTYWAAIRTEIAADWPLYAFAVGYFLFSIPLVGISPQLIVKSTVLWMVKNWILLPSLLGLVVGARIILAPKGRRRTAVAVIYGPHRMGRYVAGVLFLVSMVLFQSTFTQFKYSFSSLGAKFPNDVMQANIDRMIHFGVDPFHWLFALAKNDIVLHAVEALYNQVWFLVVFGVLFYIAISPQTRRLRVRYILCYMLTWAIVGNLFASIFNSAGPIFYHLVTGDGARFSEQLGFLGHTANESTSSLATAQMLWERRADGIVSVGSGISAFPSVHVAVSALQVFFAFEASKRLGFVALAFLGFVMFGSVYLGWHYAIDGYAAIVIVAGIYYGMRAIMLNKWRWLSRRRLSFDGPDFGDVETAKIPATRL